MAFKNLLSFALVLLLALTGTFAQADSTASKYTEGVHYTTFKTPIKVGSDASKVEVVEMFWAGCPHCYHLEPHVQKWKKSVPSFVEFIKLPSVLNPSWKLHARAFFAAEALLAGDKFHLAMFNAIHEQGRRLRREDAVVRFAERQGLDGEKFREAMNSKSTDEKVKQVAKLGKDYGLTGVPSLMVAGKYKVNSASVKSYDELFALVDFLVKKERQEQKS